MLLHAAGLHHGRHEAVLGFAAQLLGVLNHLRGRNGFLRRQLEIQNPLVAHFERPEVFGKEVHHRILIPGSRQFVLLRDGFVAVLMTRTSRVP